MGMILLAWFDHKEERFCLKEVQIKRCCLPVKPFVLPLKTFNYETPAFL